MRKYMLIMALLLVFINPLFAQFAKDCPTLAQQQAAYDAKTKAPSALGTTVNASGLTAAQEAKDRQQQAKDRQQQAKDAQQQAKDAQQAETDARLTAASHMLDRREFKYNNQKPDPNYKCPQPCCNPLVKKEEPVPVPVCGAKAVCPPKVTCQPEAKEGYVCWKKGESDGWYKTHNGQEWVTNWKGTFIDGIPEPEHKKLEKEAKKKFPVDAFQCANELAKLKGEYKVKHTNRSGGGDSTNPGGGGNENGFLNPNQASN